MAETVFILGAGASKQGGAPLMAEFLDVAELLWRRGEIQDSDVVKDFERVFATLAKLQVVHSKSELDITNIESAFAAFEMAKTLTRLPGTGNDQIEAAILALKRVIATTIELTLKLPTTEGAILPPPPYDKFADLVDYLRQKARPTQGVAILTFNYDMALDYAWHVKGIRLDYGLEDGQPGRAVPILKLHGSLNWGTCTKCNKVVPWELRTFLPKYDWGHSLPSKVSLNISSWLAKHKHCDAPLAPEPVIVPPTWNKGEYHTALSRVWANAAKELSGAENIFVCGYSLPETDAFFRYLYALGTVGDRPLKRFWVCDPDTSGSVSSRFERMLGPGARRRFEYRPENFELAIKSIKREFPERG